MAVLLPQISAARDVPRVDGLPAMPAVCRHCGFIRLHWIALLEEKLETNPHNVEPNGHA
jgi:hypothetical protein